MRLLNTRTHLLEEFLDEGSIPPYAILSHTWGEEEVSFKEMADLTTLDIHRREGHCKIDMACRVAASEGEGYEYIWIDTCCIDKSSSAELTEAINSMYNWYSRAEVCYVYFYDLTMADSEAVDPPLKTRKDLAKCKWYFRGWTLQELIAPKNITFFDKDWVRVGCKQSLVKELSAITKISEAILQHRQDLSTVSVAQKMSWAAHRHTTRVEDAAYCLLGIFSVHLPLIYGEKHRAFRRLQEAILTSGSDLSIFSWRRQPSSSSSVKQDQPRKYCGLLASEPSWFSESGPLVKKRRYDRAELFPCNGAIKVKMQFLVEMTHLNGGYRYLLPLDCAHEGNPSATLCVRLRKYGPNEFIRENPDVIETFVGTDLRKPIIPSNRYLLLDVPIRDMGTAAPRRKPFDLIGQSRTHAIQFKLPLGMSIQMLDISPGHRFDGEDVAFYLNEESDYDSCMARMRVGVLSPLAGGSDKADFECMFCALGWSSISPRPGDTGALQCAVLDYREYAAAFSEFRFDARGWDFHRAYFLERLVFHGMPRRSCLVIEVRRADTGQSEWVRVRFEASRVRDENVCRNEYWRVEFFLDRSNDGDMFKEVQDGGGLGWDMVPT